LSRRGEGAKVRGVDPSTDDLRVEELRPLISPAILLEELPLTEPARAVVVRTRREATAILKGEDRRLLVVVGPCSIHDAAAAREYGERLREQAARLADELCVVMRVYFEKPRTTVGWKGLINDPHLDGSFAINRGLRLARGLLTELAATGVPAGTEFLDTISPQFFADAIAWGAIGARTTESQVHRELASGLSVPIGFKNGTDGGVRVAIDAILATRHPHRFLGVTKQGICAIVGTRGNDACHVILRGGARGTNYDRASVDGVASELAKHGLVPRVMVDCSHGNSGKAPERQVEVAESVAEQLRARSPHLLGVMIESHLVGGRQEAGPADTLRYGQSITDACLGWEATVPVLENLARAVHAARQS
jgi:3-deoxy-7-phosphoheptulonate synthase